jgi:hypothetical protein
MDGCDVDGGDGVYALIRISWIPVGDKRWWVRSDSLEVWIWSFHIYDYKRERPIDRLYLPHLLQGDPEHVVDVRRVFDADSRRAKPNANKMSRFWPLFWRQRFSV